MALHDFIKMAGLKSEKEFYSKFSTPEAFFKKFPKAAQGYTLQQDPVVEYDPNGNPIYIENVEQPQPILPQNTPKGNSFSSAAAPFMAGAREVGQMFSDVIPAAMTAINGMVREQSNTRYKPVQESYNQYAYGTGSKAMWENGGSSPLDEYYPRLMMDDSVLPQREVIQPIDPYYSLDPATAPKQYIPQEQDLGVTPPTISVPTQQTKTSAYKGNFKEAFAAARKNKEGVFSWNGKKYTTQLASESKNKTNSPTVRDAKPSTQKLPAKENNVAAQRFNPEQNPISITDKSFWDNTIYGKNANGTNQDVLRATPSNPITLPDNKFSREFLRIVPANMSDAQIEHNKALLDVGSLASVVGAAEGLIPRISYEAIPMTTEVARRGAKKAAQVLLKEAPRQLPRGVKPNGFISTAGFNFENGGDMGRRLNYNQAQDYELNNIPYQVAQDRANVPMMQGYPNMPQYANPNTVPYSSRYITEWEPLPQQNNLNSIDILDRWGNKVRTEQYEGALTDFLKSNKEKNGYGLFTTMDTTGKTAIDVRADGRNKISKKEDGGYVQGQEYDLDAATVAKLRSLGYKIKML